jgi:polysaccharide deacetylase family protein (PEP-CTERM system associated)
MKNKSFILTVDVEDWFQVQNLRKQFPVDSWDKQQLRVERSTMDILDLIDTHNLKRPQEKLICATFFVLASIAKVLPDLVCEIHRRGHEVASHGYNHIMPLTMGAEEFKEDLEKSKKLLEDTIGALVSGYRAPSFAIDLEKLQAVAGAGYRYSSSYNCFGGHPRYGSMELGEFPNYGNAIEVSPDFFELPISNLSLLGKTIPLGGGGYFRLLPTPLFSAGVSSILKRDSTYLFYTHPWEFDPEQPRVSNLKWLSRFRHYVNLAKTFNKLDALLTTFSDCSFQSCTGYLDRNIASDIGLKSEVS